MTRLILAIVLALFPLTALAQETTTEPPENAAPDISEQQQPMTLERLDQIVRALDPEAESDGRLWRFQIANVPILIVTDIASDRMRAFAPVREAKDLSPEDMARVLQANFDTALDARYGIAKDTLWSIFIHPLSPLEKDQFISGLGQVVNLAASYGTLYSGGGLQYGDGDSGELQRALIDELLKKGQEI